jgi:hypothetical protein
MHEIFAGYVKQPTFHQYFLEIKQTWTLQDKSNYNWLINWSERTDIHDKILNEFNCSWIISNEYIHTSKSHWFNLTHFKQLISDKPTKFYGIEQHGHL